MALLSRIDLEGLFKNGKKPSQKEFSQFIESTLNKRDDKFMGIWKAGRTYRSGDVVIYDRGFWEVEPGYEAGICSQVPPSTDPGNPWQSLTTGADNDWQVFLDERGMYAKAYDLVGIGREFSETDKPEAKLELLEAGKSRYLIFPKPAGMPVLSLFNLEGGDVPAGAVPGKTYFLTGLDTEQVGFTTDTAAFVFRNADYCEDGQEAGLDFRAGDVLMTIRSDKSSLAMVGINTLAPAAMLDITDSKRGQILFNPEDKDDPAFTIINLDPGTAKNYLASGVGATNAVFLSDAANGFVFRKGAEYGEYCSEVTLNQGKGLMIVLQDEQERARVGIGTEEPCGLLDVTDQTTVQFAFKPDANGAAVAHLIKKQAGNPDFYLTNSVNGEKTAWMTNTPKGYAFKRGDNTELPCDENNTDNGESLVVILPDGKVGIGVEDPAVRLEVSDKRETGRFLFNLDDLDNTPNPALAIINTRPDDSNYLTLGANNDTSVLITNAPFGFSFRIGGNADENDNPINIDQNSETLLNIRPEYAEGENVFPKELRIFPERKGQKKGEVHVNGRVGVLRKPKNFELDVAGMTRAYGLYLNTDSQKMDEVTNLRDVMERVKKLRPVTFKWDESTGLQREGKQIGFVAHEVGDIFPELVKNTPLDREEDQTKSIAYQNLVAVLVQAIKEQQVMIDDLKTRVENLEGQRHHS